jgi:cysteine-rich repeat protein
LLVLAFALGTLLAGPAQAAPVFGPTTGLSTDVGADFETDLATDGGGTWVAVWDRQNGRNDVMLSRSTDNGGTWSPAIALYPNVSATRQYYPHVATDRAGTWVVVWESEFVSGEDRDIAFVRSIDNGQTWSLPAPLNTTAVGDSGYDGAPQVTTDRAGNWVAVWHSEENALLDAGFLASRSVDNGATWLPPTVLFASTSGADGEPVLATDRQGRWIAHWPHYAASATAIVFSRSIDIGETWSPPQTLSTAYPSSVVSGDLVTDGTTWIASWVTPDFFIMSARSTDQGMSWSPPTLISGVHGYTPRMATDGAHWVAVWEDCAIALGCEGSSTTDSDDDIYVSESLDAGLTWSPRTTVNTNAATDVATDAESHVETDGAGTWIVIWRTENLMLYARQACGDGLIGFDESCDDGNVVAGDGCSATCHLEPPATPTPTPTPTATPTPTCAATPQCGNKVREGSEECDLGSWNGKPDMKCSATCTCIAPVGSDVDHDGVDARCDNCPTDANPDQLNSDCTGKPGTDVGCEKGDRCDPCPALRNDTECDPLLSDSKIIGPEGGTLSLGPNLGTTPPNATITIIVPPGALCSERTISVTNEKGPDTAFTLASGKYALRPEGLALDQPATIRLAWADADNGVGDGQVDGGVCSNAPITCDAPADCSGTGTCSHGGGQTAETAIFLRRDGKRFNRDGFLADCGGANGDNCRCPDHAAPVVSSQCPAGGTPHAICTGPAGQGCATVALACSTTDNAWEFETCDFSDMLLGEAAAGLVPGGGSAGTDCMVEWVVQNPLNQPATDHKGLPSRTQSCADGDPLCDADGTANGVCAFRVGLCVNLADARLRKRDVAVCHASTIGTFELRKPRLTSRVAVEAANAAALRNTIASIGVATFSSQHPETLIYSPPLADADACTDPVEVNVPLRGGATGKTTLGARATAAALPGQHPGAKDSDTLKLVCLPPE